VRCTSVDVNRLDRVTGHYEPHCRGLYQTPIAA